MQTSTVGTHSPHPHTRSAQQQHQPKGSGNVNDNPYSTKGPAEAWIGPHPGFAWVSVFAVQLAPSSRVTCIQARQACINCNSTQPVLPPTPHSACVHARSINTGSHWRSAPQQQQQPCCQSQVATATAAPPQQPPPRQPPPQPQQPTAAQRLQGLTPMLA